MHDSTIFRHRRPAVAWLLLSVIHATSSARADVVSDWNDTAQNINVA